MQKTLELNTSTNPVINELSALLDNSEDIYQDTADFVSKDDNFNGLCQMWEEGSYLLKFVHFSMVL